MIERKRRRRRNEVGKLFRRCFSSQMLSSLRDFSCCPYRRWVASTLPLFSQACWWIEWRNLPTSIHPNIHTVTAYWLLRHYFELVIFATKMLMRPPQVNLARFTVLVASVSEIGVSKEFTAFAKYSTWKLPSCTQSIEWRAHFIIGQLSIYSTMKLFWFISHPAALCYSQIIKHTYIPPPLMPTRLSVSNMHIRTICFPSTKYYLISSVCKNNRIANDKKILFIHLLYRIYNRLPPLTPSTYPLECASSFRLSFTLCEHASISSTYDSTAIRYEMANGIRTKSHTYIHIYIYWKFCHTDRVDSHVHSHTLADRVDSHIDNSAKRKGGTRWWWWKKIRKRKCREKKHWKRDWL